MSKYVVLVRFADGDAVDALDDGAIRALQPVEAAVVGALVSLALQNINRRIYNGPVVMPLPFQPEPPE